MSTKTVKGSFDWMSNPQYLAQVGHLFGAYFYVTLSCNTALLIAANWWVWLLFGVGVAAATFKEFVFDTASWGEGDSWSDSLMDWSFYMGGGVLGLGATLLWHSLLGRLVVHFGVLPPTWNDYLPF